MAPLPVTFPAVPAHDGACLFWDNDGHFAVTHAGPESTVLHLDEHFGDLAMASTQVGVSLGGRWSWLCPSCSEATMGRPLTSCVDCRPAPGDPF